MDENRMREIVREEMAKIFHSDKYHFARDVQIANGRNIELGKSVGTMIGTEATQKLAFFGATPIVKQTGALRDVGSDPTPGAEGYDNYARAGIGDINGVLASFGLATT
jgi:hypothetical protein